MKINNLFRNFYARVFVLLGLAIFIAAPSSFSPNAASAVDACQANTKISVPISQTANAKLFSAAASKKNIICGIIAVGADSESLSLVEGTGSVCASSTAALIGATTAANGMTFAANGGFNLGNGGFSVVIGANNNFDVCLFQSGVGRVSGVILYVQV